jgi:hypothetical protein
MSKICFAIVGVLMAPLLVWLTLPMLMCVVGLAPLVLPLAALVLVAARPRSAIDVPAAPATRALPARKPVAERRWGLPVVSHRFLDREPSNAVSFFGTLQVHK